MVRTTDVEPVENPQLMYNDRRKFVQGRAFWDTVNQ